MVSSTLCYYVYIYSLGPDYHVYVAYIPIITSQKVSNVPGFFIEAAPVATPDAAVVVWDEIDLEVVVALVVSGVLPPLNVSTAVVPPKNVDAGVDLLVVFVVVDVALLSESDVVVAVLDPVAVAAPDMTPV